jgi:hypothetical protein
VPLSRLISLTEATMSHAHPMHHQQRLADYCSGFLHVTRSSYFAGTAAQ